MAMNSLFGLTAIGVFVAVTATFAGGLRFRSLRVPVPKLNCFSRPQTHDDVPIPYHYHDIEFVDKGLSTRYHVTQDVAEIPEIVKEVIHEIKASQSSMRILNEANSNVAAANDESFLDISRIVSETLVNPNMQVDDFGFSTICHQIRSAISVISLYPTKTFEIIKPLYDHYEQLTSDQRNVLRNLAILQRMVVMYDLVRIIEHRMASILRRSRYTIQFPELRQMHRDFEPLALSRAYAALRKKDEFVDHPFRQSVKEKKFIEMGLDSKRVYRNNLFNDVTGKWEEFQIQIDSIVGNAICDIDFRYIRNLDEPSPSLNVLGLDFEFIKSPFYIAISDIGNKVLNMIQAVRPTDTKFLSVYEVPYQRHHFTTEYLQTLLDGELDANNGNALESLNLALESGLYREYERLSDQVPDRKLLLNQLLQKQRSLTVTRASDQSFDLFNYYAKYSIQFDLLSAQGQQLYELAKFLIEFAVSKFLDGAGPEMLLYHLCNDSPWALPVLRFDFRHHRWEAVSLPLEIIVEFALQVAVDYGSDLAVSHDQDGNTFFSYQSDNDAGKDILHNAFISHFDHSLLTLLTLNE